MSSGSKLGKQSLSVLLNSSVILSYFTRFKMNNFNIRTLFTSKEEIPFLLMMDNGFVETHVKLLEIQNTAANYQFLVEKDTEQLQVLDLLRPFTKQQTWQDWDEMKALSVQRLVNSIINKQKQIISLIDNYPMTCSASTCDLPSSVRATSTELTSSEVLRSNAMELIRIQRQVNELRVRNIHTNFSRARAILDRTPQTDLVNTTTFDYDLGSFTGRMDAGPTFLMYRLALESQALKLSPNQDQAYRLLDRNFESLTRQFNQNIAGSPSRAPRFEEQTVALYFDSTNMTSTLQRKVTSFFVLRVVQITAIIMMEKYNAELLARSMQREGFREGYDMIKGFIEGIYSRLVSAYANGALKSVPNIRYIPPNQMGSGPISKAIRKLNNLMIFGPLLRLRPG